MVHWFTCQPSPSSTRYRASSCRGQVLGSVVAFAGVGLFGLPAGIISSGFAEIFSSRGAVPGVMVGEFLGKRPEYLDWGDLV